MSRRDLPQADRVDSIRDALYPARPHYGLQGVPLPSPWVASDVSRIVFDGKTLAEAPEANAPGPASVLRVLTIGAAPFVAAEAAKQPWVPRVLVESGPIKAKKRRAKLAKPLRRGGVVIAAPAPQKGAKAPAGSGSETATSDEEDEGLSGAEGSEDGSEGGSGDELTL